MSRRVERLQREPAALDASKLLHGYNAQLLGNCFTLLLVFYALAWPIGPGVGMRLAG